MLLFIYETHLSRGFYIQVILPPYLILIEAAEHLASLGWEDPLEKGMATHSSILAWEIPWTEEPDKLQSMGLQRVRHHLSAEQQQQLAGQQPNASSSLFSWGL